MTTSVLTPLTADGAEIKIKALEQLIATSSSNMVELTSERTFMMLGSPTFARLEGDTKRQCEAVIPAFEELFGMITLMHSQVDKAKAIMASLPRIAGREAKLTEVTTLLSEIKLPPVAVPLEKRGLLTGAEMAQTVSADRLLEAMATSFTEASTLIFRIKAAWATLNAKVGKHEEALKLLQQEATSLGATAPELTDAESALATVRGAINGDPLSADGNFEAQVLPVIEACRTRLGQLKALKNQVVSQLAEAEQALAHLKTTHANSLQAVEERKAKLTVEHEDQLTMPLDAKVIDQLETWLERLKTTVKDGKFQAASVGLVNWTAQVLNRTSSAESAFQANDALLRERRDMRGLIQALKVRAAAEGMAEDAVLAAMFSQVSQLLYSRPTPMTEARQLVKEYQDKVLK
ncbi:hypothetical protein BH11CYA1_BH11CYA1_23480 [soil metagenome]